jgi:hypothetical protein
MNVYCFRKYGDYSVTLTIESCKGSYDEVFFTGTYADRNVTGAEIDDIK